jgi:hypothetical protein
VTQYLEHVTALEIEFLSALLEQVVDLKKGAPPPD